MGRLLLSLALAGTQLLSWGASPLYVCFQRDGGLCVEAGPAACHCCRHKDDLPKASAVSSCTDQCPHHQDETLGEERSKNVAFTLTEDCDCLHLPLAQSQGPVIVSLRGTLDRSGQSSPVTEMTGHTDLMIVRSAFTTAERAIRLSWAEGHSLSRIVLDTVVLRC